MFRGVVTLALHGKRKRQARLTRNLHATGALARRTRKGVARQPLPGVVYECVYLRAVSCARTSRTSWSLCAAVSTSAEGERSAPLP